jgi:hypothetical protein
MNEIEKKRRKEIAIKYYAEVPVYRYTAMKIGIDEETLMRWRKEDVEFVERLQEARAMWVEKNVRRVAPEFKLKSLERELFGDNVDVRVTFPQPILGGESEVHSDDSDEKDTQIKEKN